MDTRQIFDDVLEAIGGEVFSDAMVEDARSICPENTRYTFLLDVENYTFEELNEMVERGEFIKKLKALEDGEVAPENSFDAYGYFVGETDSYPNFPGVVITVDETAAAQINGEYDETKEYLKRNNVDLFDTVLFDITK